MYRNSPDGSYKCTPLTFVPVCPIAGGRLEGGRGLELGAIRKAGLRQVTCLVRERQLRLYGHVARLPAEDPAHRILSPRSKGLVHAEVASTRFMVASDGGLSEGYGHGGPGVCLGDVQTEDEGVPSQGGRDDALFRRMSPYLTVMYVYMTN